MSAKKILCIGLELASDQVEECAFNSNTSLLDWDIVLFRPDIGEFIAYAEYFQGKPCLNDSSSFRLKERSEHWRREIKDAVQGGKSVLVFMPNLLEVYVDSGNRTYSGTGKNRQTNRHVDLHDNYRCIPANLEPVSSSGSSIKLAAKGAEVLAAYWQDFEDHSHYEVILTGEKIPAALLTRSGDKPVGAIYRNKTSNGALVLLPNIDFYPEEFLIAGKEGQSWTDKAFQFAARLIGSVVALDRALKSGGELTPEPAWAQVPDFELASERDLRSQLLQLERQLESLQQSKETLVDQVMQHGRLRYLLYEKGHALESAIVDALHLLGFSASQYKDSESEFDVVFESTEGRLIGEAEGKDNKAINVDKLRQLAMNIHEDFQRESINKPAKGVLFGCAYRLTPLGERSTPFTEKCITAALASSTALVSTPELFQAAKYLSDCHDDAFSAACRAAIISGVGLVSFPTPPSTGQGDPPNVATANA